MNSTKTSGKPKASSQGEVQLTFYKPVLFLFLTLLATKGAGLLGKTDWSDEEDEEEESNKQNAEQVAPDEIGQLPQIDKAGTGEDIVIQSKNQRVTLMARPEMPIVSNDDTEPCKLNVIYISNISQDDVQVRNFDTR